MSFSKNRRSVDNINWNFKRQNQIILPEKNKFSRKSFQTKKLKTLLSLYDAQVSENKNKRKSSIFHFIGEEDKFKQIEKNIQKSILKMSMTIIGNSKLDPIKRLKTKKRQKSKVDINPFNLNQNSNPENKLKKSYNMKEIMDQYLLSNKKINKFAFILNISRKVNLGEDIQFFSKKIK